MRPINPKKLTISGIFVTVLSILFFIFSFYLSKENSLFETQLHLYTKVSNVENLKEGAAVQLKGKKVGTVTKIFFESLDTIVIVMRVSERYQDWIKKDSFISIRTQGVLGDKFAEILGGTVDEESVGDHDFIEIKRSKQVSDFLSGGDTVLTAITKVLQNTNTLLRDLNDDHRLKNIVSNMDKSTAHLSKIFNRENRDHINTILREMSVTSKALSKTSEDLAMISSQANKGPGTLHSLLYDNAVYEDLQTLFGGAKRNKVLKYFIRESIKKSEN